jgi:hypothetical protein
MKDDILIPTLQEAIRIPSDVAGTLAEKRTLTSCLNLGLQRPARHS